MGRINVNIYNQDEYHDSQPCQQQPTSKQSIHHDAVWIPVAIFLSIFFTVGYGTSRYPSGGGGSSPVIINNR